MKLYFPLDYGGESIKNLVGEILNNHFGTPMQIIHWKSTSDIDVEFLDQHHYIKEHAAYVNFKRGTIKNPYDKLICGVGYLGDGPYKTGTHSNKTWAYDMWTTMLHRCYGKRGSYPDYNGVTTVSEKWHNYQNFADWHAKNAYTVDGRLHLDKDILVPGNKEYTPDKCLLVPQRINMLFLNKRNQTGLPNGIRRTKNGKYTARYNSFSLGVFETLDEAFAAYANAKENRIKEVADEYRAIIPAKLYDALCSYKVLISNDKNYNKKQEESTVLLGGTHGILYATHNVA